MLHFFLKEVTLLARQSVWFKQNLVQWFMVTSSRVYDKRVIQVVKL